MELQFSISCKYIYKLILSKIFYLKLMWKRHKFILCFEFP